LLNDIRKDYILNRWVVIATHRRRRPTDLAKEHSHKHQIDKASCPFCPGNERKTPPAVLVYLKRNGALKKSYDTNGLRHKNWVIRCVPNLYSAFSPPENDESLAKGQAVGHHEVLVESPNHDEHPSTARADQLIHVINGYVDRLRVLYSKPYVEYVSIFRNHGLEAGASLSHAHSQLIAAPITPSIPSEEFGVSYSNNQKKGTCVYCDIIKRERDSPRFIWENRSYVALAPWGGIHPFEFWILPKEHQGTLLVLKPENIRDLAVALKTCLNGLKSLLNDPPYNYGFHIAPKGAPEKCFHWHLEVYPKLITWAGFEKSNGMYINVVPPEEASENLRNAIKSI